MGIEETKFSQVDFSGGLNSNARIAENYLQEATNVDVQDFGVLRPALADTLIKTVANVLCVQVLDGQIYYLVGTTLSRVESDGTGTVALGTIGGSYFTAQKWGGIHIIIATDAVYKVVEDSIYNLGVTAPAAAPTVVEANSTSATTDYENKSFDVNSEDATPACLFFKPDGTKMYFMGFTNKSVFQYSLSTAWDVDTANYDSKSFSVNGEETSPYGLFFKPDGTKMYIVGQTNDTVFQYSLSTAWDVDTASYDSKSFSVNSEDATPLDIFFKSDGTKMYFIGSTNDTVFQYSLSTAWDVDTASYDSKSFSVSGEDTFQFGLFFKSDGTKMYFMGSNNDTVFQYSLSAAWDIYVGALTGTFNVSYSYVAKLTLADGSAYEEESGLSDEVEITVDSKDISVSVIADSGDSQVTHKRVYIRGEGLVSRYRSGEIATGVTIHTIDQTESALVLLSIEDSENNYRPPLTPIHGAVFNGQLFVAAGRNVYWSRTLILSAFPTDNYAELPYDVKAIYAAGSNLAILMTDNEVIYINPGYSATAGGYLHYPKNPQGCISTRSAARGYHASDEGMTFFEGSEPVIFTQAIRSELIALSGRSSTIGAYLRGRFYFCIPAESVMYEYEFKTARFLKYDGIIDVCAGDDGELYIVKTGGIYSFGTATTRKAFAYRTPEVFLPEDVAFDRIAIEADFGTDEATIEFYVNDTVATTVTRTTSGRQMVYVPVSRKGGSAVSARISSASAISYTNFSVYGVHLR